MWGSGTMLIAATAERRLPNANPDVVSMPGQGTVARGPVGPDLQSISVRYQLKVKTYTTTPGAGTRRRCVSAVKLGQLFDSSVMTWTFSSRTKPSVSEGSIGAQGRSDRVSQAHPADSTTSTCPSRRMAVPLSYTGTKRGVQPYSSSMSVPHAGINTAASWMGQLILAVRFHARVYVGFVWPNCRCGIGLCPSP